MKSLHVYWLIALFNLMTSVDGNNGWKNAGITDVLHGIDTSPPKDPFSL